MLQEEQLTEEKIFSAAMEIFEEKGMTGARMQDIADRAGINKALLHYYFRTKEKLFEVVFDKLAEKMFEKFAAIFEMDMQFEEKIIYFYREHIAFLQKNEKLPVFILVEVARNPELLEKFLKKIEFSRIKESLKKDIPGDIPDKEIAHLMITIISLSVFPVAARPIIEGILSLQGESFDNFLEERKSYSSKFILSALKNREGSEGLQKN
ncbi:MAG: TetR/AcrR family transcriptional regulator [Bacteroidia bacterium]|nr:MAG: TetR/AcrR family transcriptional regulator [Bacteroidia bacterium]